VRFLRVRWEACGESHHLAGQPGPGAADMGSGKIDPCLDVRNLGTPSLRHLVAGDAPGLEHPRPVEKQPGILDPTLRPPGQLVSLGQLGRVALQGCSCLVEIISGGSQRAH